MPVDIRLLDEPISRTVLEADARLTDLTILRNPVDGNPQPVTPEHLTVIGRYIPTAYKRHYGLIAEARAIVADAYSRAGWHVKRTHAPGWDLTCTHADQELRVAVRPRGRIVLDQAQATAAATDPLWRLIVVDGPRHDEYDGPKVLANAEPIAFRVPDL